MSSQVLPPATYELSAHEGAEYLRHFHLAGKKTCISAKKCPTFKLFFLINIRRFHRKEAAWILPEGSRD